MDNQEIISYLKEYRGPVVRLMEICGSHTAAIAKSGIRTLLSDRIQMISGPGCPVCVTVTEYIDRLIALSKKEGNAVCTFGDLIRVPGSHGSLGEAKAEGADIRMLYSPMDMIELAAADKSRTFIFAAVGFETTTPVYAEMIRESEENGLDNIRLLTSLKTMPEVVDLMGSRVDGYILPGHVCTVSGYEAYEKYALKYSIPFVAAGFEPDNIIKAIYALVRLKGRGMVKNFYPSVVTRSGNIKAQEAVDTYFEAGDASWRGLGTIPGSGMYLKGSYRERYDAGSFGLDKDEGKEGCRCAEVITGEIVSRDCPLFGKACTPADPKGACMVSREGVCFSEFISGSGS